jgi:hypothetical protein
MKLSDLVKMCEDNIRVAEETGTSAKLFITLPTVSKNVKYHQPFGFKGPKCTVVQWGYPKGRDTVFFDTRELLIWLKANPDKPAEKE